MLKAIGTSLALFTLGVGLAGATMNALDATAAHAVTPAQRERIIPAQGLPCGPVGSIQDQLATKYGEIPVSYGLRSNGNLFTIYASDRGTWTAVTTTPLGMSCVVAAGKGWVVMPQSFGRPT